MPSISAAELLSIWEKGRAEPPHRRALLLLVAEHGATAPEDIARWSIGERDAALWRLRERLFGVEVASLTSCPACSETVEFALRTDDLLITAPAPAPAVHRACAGEHEAAFRLPDSLDVAALEPGVSAEESRRILLSRCVLAIHRQGAELGIEAMPPALESAIVAGMAAADPRADLRLELACPACAHRWEATLDVVSYLWRELHAWSTRLLREVHALAVAYGWGEREILALSPWRRRFYLELVGA